MKIVTGAALKSCTPTFVAVMILFSFFTTILVPAAKSEAPPIGDTWRHIAALPPSTHLHVAADTKGKNCFFVSSDDEKLVCSRGENASGASYIFARVEVKSVKLTRYGRSTLFGILIGGGAGTGIGAIIGRVRHPNNPQAFLDFSGLSRDVDIGLGAAVGLAAGGAIGGPADWLRGPTIYRRPGTSR